MSNANTTSLDLLRRLWLHIPAERRKRYLILLVLILLSSIAEVVSIGAVLPFLAVLTSPEKILQHSIGEKAGQFFNISHPSDLLLPITVAFCLLVLTAGMIRVLLLWMTTSLAFESGADFSLNMFRRTIYQPYSIHTKRNSSDIINSISNKSSTLITGAVAPALNLLSSIFLFGAIVLVLFYIEPRVAFLSFSVFLSVYYLVWRSTRQKLLHYGHEMSIQSTNVIKSLQESLGGIRDILIDGTQNAHCRSYAGSNIALRRAQGLSTFISQCPKYGIEMLGIVFIALIAFGMSKQTNGEAALIPVLGAFALAAQRLLPLMQQIYVAWTSLRSSHYSLIDAVDLLDQPLPEYALFGNSYSMSFENNIVLKNVFFRYDGQASWAICGLSFTIEKGDRVGVVGATGSGKSTVLDIIMGLLIPQDGYIEVDGVPITPSNQRSWQMCIAHVPQTIFLTDSTIAENISLCAKGNGIDYDRVRDSARQAQLLETIDAWPEGLQTIVGERGVRISGGQRQRIGIARALYKKAEIIVFDEATSALDNETEASVMNAINGLDRNLTLIMVAHRISTLRQCNKIVEIADGGIRRVGKYEDFI